MPLILIKLLITPIMIGGATWAGRRFGVVVSGLLVGLPLTSGPISAFLAYQYGPDFAARTAVGSLAGGISNCVFAVVYVWVSRRAGWRISAAAAVVAYVLSIFALNAVAWRLVSALVGLLLACALAALLIPNRPITRLPGRPPRWDLPARIVAATSLVIALTAAASALGPQLSGLIAPVPIFVVIFSTFTHAQQGATAAATLLRGVVMASVPFAIFFVIVVMLLADWGLGATYLSATLAAICVGGIAFAIGRRRKADRQRLSTSS
jgi:hypothetical protein